MLSSCDKFIYDAAGRAIARSRVCFSSRLFAVSATIALGVALASSTGDAAAAQATTQATVLDASRGVIQLNSPRSESDMHYRIDLERGKSASIKTGYTVKRVSVGDPDVLEVVVLGGREIQLVSKDVGTTNLLIWDAKGRPQAVIDVEINTAHAQVERALQATFSNDSLDVSSAGNAIVLKGSVPSLVELEQTVNLASAMLSEKDSPRLVNLLEVGGHQQVMLQVVIAEMSRTVSREMGMNANALIDTGTGTISIGSDFIDGVAALSETAALFGGTFVGLGSLELLEVFLDILDERGLSKILAKPTLVSRSGETASFLVGGEIPIPVPQDLSSVTIEFKDFGVGLAFTPTVLGPDRIHLDVKPEVSRPDDSFGLRIDDVGIIPGFVTRRASTSVELGDGQSFMIAGLLSEQIRELAGRYPLLGEIPIFGSLFRSTQFLKEETELVIIVTPNLVKPLGAGPHPLPTDTFIEPTDADQYLLGVLEGGSFPTPWTEGGQPVAEGIIGDNGYRMSATMDGESE